jgi:single-stranded-DNA-specific exonuclease
MVSKNWRISPPVPPEYLRRYERKGIHPLLAQVLYNRGLTELDNAYAFLTAEGGASFNAFQITDIAKAVSRVKRAIRAGELIVVYGDFDADGVTSTALVMTVLYKLGAKAKFYIPNRVDEGYGLNVEALQTIHSWGAKLVITVDCGIRSVTEVTAGNAMGLDMIVTDHHSLGPELPPALAVVNPKRDKAPVETMLAGVGVAYKFAEALVMSCKQNERKHSKLKVAAERIDIDTLLDLVAIGTVADLVPLNRLENRLLVRRGLRVLNQAKRPGVRALLEVAGIAPGAVDTTSIGFGLGPRINAAGRLESAATAYRLLISRDDDTAKNLADHLQDLNTRRQELTREAQNIVRQDIEAIGGGDVPLIFASHAGFQHGIVGLVAGRLTEEYYRPAIVMREGEGESHASCRSIPQFDITHALDQCDELLLRHGGHAQAAGFTVLNENVPALRERLIMLAAQVLDGQELRPTLNIDAEVNINQLDETLLNELRHIEPTGSDNPPPLLMSSNAHVADWRTVGSDEKHLKLRLTRAGQPPIDAIGFNLGEWAGKLPEWIDVAYELEINEWNGRRTLQLNLKDIRPASANGK